MTSPDGITWTGRVSSADNTWRGLAYGAGMWVATSTSGTDWIMTSGAASLPVKWKSFTVRTVEDGNALRWETSSEVNNAGFEVERSTDGRTFQAIGKVAAHADGTDGAVYTFLDGGFSGAVNFYRLKRVDQDGRYDYSQVVKTQNRPVFTLFPNPAGAVVRVNGLPAGAGQLGYTITHMDGRVVQSGMLAADRSIDVAGLARGTYLLRIDGQVRQFMKE